MRISNRSGLHWQYVHVEWTCVLQGRCQPSLLCGLLFHWRVGYRAEHFTAGRSVLGVPSAAHSALPHHQLHERLFHLQEYARHHAATVQVTWQLNNMDLAIWPSDHDCSYSGHIESFAGSIQRSRKVLIQCLSTFVRPRPGKHFFHKTRARSQQIYS